MYLLNSFALASSNSHFDAWSVAAHVHAIHQSWRMGGFRNGSSLSSSLRDRVPCRHREYIVLRTAPSYFRHLYRIQPDDVLIREPRYRVNLTRNALQSRAIFSRSFISTDTAPTPVGTAVTSNNRQCLRSSFVLAFRLMPVL